MFSNFFNFTLPEPDYRAQAMGLAALLVPFGLFGVHAIYKAFRGNRYIAIRGGLFAGVPGVLYYALLYADLLNSKSPDSLPANYAWLFCPGIFPLATGFWAILLAYLIPEKQPSDD